MKGRPIPPGKFFDEYTRAGPVFRYRPRDGVEEREVFRLIR